MWVEKFDVVWAFPDMSTLQYLHLALTVSSDGKSGGISKCSLQDITNQLATIMPSKQLANNYQTTKNCPLLSVDCQKKTT